MSRLFFGVGFGETDLRSGGLLPEGVSEAGLLSPAEGPRFLGVEIQSFSSIARKPWPHVRVQDSGVISQDLLSSETSRLGSFPASSLEAGSSSCSIWANSSSVRFREGD
jgi:hypothetical protein